MGRAVGVTGESGHCPGTRVHLPAEEQRASFCILESLLRLLFKEPMTAEQVFGGGVGGDPWERAILPDPDPQSQKQGKECAPCRQRVLWQV